MYGCETWSTTKGYEGKMLRGSRERFREESLDLYETRMQTLRAFSTDQTFKFSYYLKD